MQQTVETTEGKTAGLAETGLVATGLAETGRTATGLAEASLATAGLNATRAAEAGRKRVEAVVETLAKLQGKGESLAEVAHDTRNMVTALGLYCDLLEEPGVLTPAHLHYANELRLVATASRRLVEKLLALDARQQPSVKLSGAGSLPEAGSLSGSDGFTRADGFRTTGSSQAQPGAGFAATARLERARRWDLTPAEPIDDLAGELMANRNLLSALAGPSIALVVEIEGGARPVRLTNEDLTRILVNLVKNAAEAMTSGGQIALGLHEFHAGDQAASWLVLTVEDTGPGIPRKALEKIFESGYTTHSTGGTGRGVWPASHHGLGLSITRSIVEAAGGRIHAANHPPAGARFEIELPIRPS
jgi:signal transduction histidine kinase